MKTKLIELAKKVGFGAVLMQNVAYKAYPNLEPIRYYLWMCELQKWCREKHNINISISHASNGCSWYYDVCKIPFINIDSIVFVNDDVISYEQALEEGLYQTLLLIQEENEKEN